MLNIYNEPLEKLKELKDNDMLLNISNLFKTDGMDLIKKDLVKVFEQIKVVLNK